MNLSKPPFKPGDIVIYDPFGKHSDLLLNNNVILECLTTEEAVSKYSTATSPKEKWVVIYGTTPYLSWDWASSVILEKLTNSPLYKALK